jgi:SAM-dependent methyltransferase
MKTVLFVTHRQKQCGVYEFGKQVFHALYGSTKYRFVKAECDSISELLRTIEVNGPDAIIYNYHPSVMPWVCTRVSKGVYRNNIAGIKVLQIGLIHEVTQEVADTATAYRNTFILGRMQKKLNALFDFYIAADPTLLLKNPLVFKTGRLVPEYAPHPPPPVFTVGSFGFATPKKGFEKIVEQVQEEFDEAIIRLNMPSADFGDANGARARAIAERCRTSIYKKSIQLKVSHEFFTEDQLLKFLAGNSMNVFMYEDTGGRGISSAVDNALAVQRPLAVTRCPMFRHVLSASPTVCVDESSLKTIFNNGCAPLEKISKHWDKAHLVWDYERILDSVFERTAHPVKKRTGIKGILRSLYCRVFTLSDPSFTWLRDTHATAEDDLTACIVADYTPVTLEESARLNRILDDKARALYAPAAQKLFECVPLTMSKKIPRANVQQAFVFDTVYRLLENSKNPRLLCVGSYEDTASMALQKMGFEVEEIDPMRNFSLQEFYTRPSTIPHSYSIIFSTSVIEHDPDDESFMKCIAGLLSPGGYAVITCDYTDGWKPGDPKPGVDVRLYTKTDLGERLPSYVPDCELVDAPDWDCPHPDFLYLGKYRYAFASLVIQKKK